MCTSTARSTLGGARQLWRDHGAGYGVRAGRHRRRCASLVSQTDIRSACIPRSRRAACTRASPASARSTPGSAGPDEAEPVRGRPGRRRRGQHQDRHRQPVCRSRQRHHSTRWSPLHTSGASSPWRTPRPLGFGGKRHELAGADIKTTAHRWTSRWTRPPWRRLWRKASRTVVPTLTDDAGDRVAASLRPAQTSITPKASVAALHEAGSPDPGREPTRTRRPCSPGAASRTAKACTASWNCW